MNQQHETISGRGRTPELTERVIEAMNQLGVIDAAICDVFPIDPRHLETYNEVEQIKTEREKNPAMGRADRAVYEVATRRREPSHAVKWVHGKVREQLANLPREEVEKFMVNKPEPPAPLPAPKPIWDGPAPAPAPEPTPEPAAATTAAAPKRRRTTKAAAAEAATTTTEPPTPGSDSERMWLLVEEMMAIAERVTTRATATDDVIKRALELLDDDEIKAAKATLRDYLNGTEGGKPDDEVR